MALDSRSQHFIGRASIPFSSWASGLGLHHGPYYVLLISEAGRGFVLDLEGYIIYFAWELSSLRGVKVGGKFSQRFLS